MPDTDPLAPTRSDVAHAVAELDRAGLTAARWFGAGGRSIVDLELDEAVVLDDAGGHVLAAVRVRLDDGTTRRYSLPLTAASTGSAALRVAEPGDGTWRALAVAMAEGRTIPSLARDPGDPAAAVTAALVCRPGPAIVDGLAEAPERDLGAHQGGASAVLGERLVLKAYRRLRPGLDPDLEMTAFLSEDAGFPAVPRIAGFAELVSTTDGASTVAMLQEYVVDGTDAFESIAEALTAWLMAPGEVSLEFATEIVADLGTLTAALHAAVADAHGVPGMGPREATRDEVRGWSDVAREHLAKVLEAATHDAGGDAGTTLRDLAPSIAEALTVIDALATTPTVVRAHGDLHLGRVLIAPDGFRIVDFEGEPLGPPDDRRAHRHALRDVASMLRSIDRAGRTAARRAEARNGGPLSHSGLDLPGWRRRSRERFLASYRAGLLEARAWPDLDEDLLRAFEVDRELHESVGADSDLPTVSFAATEGLRALFEDAIVSGLTTPGRCGPRRCARSSRGRTGGGRRR